MGQTIEDDDFIGLEAFIIPSSRSMREAFLSLASSLAERGQISDSDLSLLRAANDPVPKEGAIKIPASSRPPPPWMTGTDEESELFTDLLQKLA